MTQEANIPKEDSAFIQGYKFFDSESDKRFFYDYAFNPYIDHKDLFKKWDWEQGFRLAQQEYLESLEQD